MFVVYAVPFVILFIVYFLKKRSAKRYFEHIPVRIVKSKTSCIAAINELLSYNPIFVGFDCEWKANTTRGEEQNKISLIQIASEHVIILIRIHLFCDSIPIELISFLNDIKIIKCGVGIYGDVKKLKHDYNMQMHGVVDINHIYDMDHYFGLERFSIQLLNRCMKYKHDINHTQWDNERLNNIQIYYASDDAIVAYRSFKQIIETLYDNGDIMEICFGKMDINLHKSKSRNKIQNISSKCRKHHKKQSNITLKSDKNDMITLVSVNNVFLSIIPKKTGKQYIKRKWAKSTNIQNTIQMLFAVNRIDINHNDLRKYQRLITLMEYKCIICGEYKNNQLMWFFIVYRYLYKFYPKSADDPYKVLICKNCNKKAVKWIHDYHAEICDRYLSNKDKYKEVNFLYKTRNVCYNLMHRRKLRKYTVTQQNEFVQQILCYCNIDKKIRESICIKESDFNDELDIDWWYSDDYNHIMIRDCIDKICKERLQRKEETNDWIRNAVLDIFKNREIEFCEMFRQSFMNTMKPKYYNKECVAFEFYVEYNLNNVEKQCKHKIVDKNGRLLTRTSVKFIHKILEDFRAKRVNNTTIQLLGDVKEIQCDIDLKSSACVMWIPFKDIECYVCGKMEDDCTLQIYNVFPDDFYRILFDIDGYDNMQCYVPLCVQCGMKGHREQKEFESYLYLKYDVVTCDKKEELLFYALRLSQKSERYRLSITEQNDYILNVLQYFNISFDDIENIKECHCNREMDMDWYYIEQYNYILMRECMDELIVRNQKERRHKLCEMFKQNKVGFIQLWMDKFADSETNSFQI